MPGGIHPPPLVVASWPKPNIVDPEIRPNTNVVIACVLGPITIVMLCARIWVRVIQQRNAGWDDWLMLASTPFVVVLTVLYPIVASIGFDRHIWDMAGLQDPGRAVLARKLIFTVECIYCAVTGMMKISILLFYRRLASRSVSKTFRWITWINIVCIVLYSFALVIAPMLGCRPMSAFWDQVNVPKVKKGYKFTCFNEGADVLSAGVISMVQDFITALLPTFLVWNLQMPRRQKFALLGVFAIGYATVGLGAYRAWQSWRIFYDTYDVTWATWELLVTSLLELHMIAFCANAPALKVFVKHFFRERRGSKASKSARDQTSLSFRKGSAGSAWSEKTVLGKISTYVSKSSRSNSVDHPHDPFSVNAYGGVRVQNNVDIRHSPLPSDVNRKASVGESATEKLYRRYEEDIELGQYTPDEDSSSTKSVAVSDGANLPIMPTSPLSARTRKPALAYSAQPQSLESGGLVQLIAPCCHYGAHP